ncbi:P-loop NTPase fold protein [Streptomyces sp. NPDC088354]|uniref:KAP family P-loop NTPase fold protein n=1 Tax=Streptomyces sp. NPDC088354 TaxID=3365856 RepID=UPI00381BF968
MWSDNEADVDLLGFDFLVDELMVALTRPRLLPLTVGLLGEWGSGKSSLLKIVADRIEAERPGDGGHYVVVPFSPWQFEGYDDIKIALMDAVLKRLQDEAASNVPAAEEIGFLRRCLNRLRRPAVFAGRTALAGVGPAAQLAATHYQPDLAPLAQAVAQQTAVMGSAALDRAEATSAAAAAPATDGDVLADVASFRSRFEALVEKLEDVTAVVVLVDDLDRCLPGTIVDTFEGIRIFLHTKKSAYVIAAHPQVVEAAIDRFYPNTDRPGASGLGAEYLEKMLQVKITIPALSAPEAETYMQLLLAQLHLGNDEFATVLNDVTQRRMRSALAVSLNQGLAVDSLGRERMPSSLFADMGWAGSIAPILGTALRGNPRQLKRFMNSVIMRQGSAQRRGTDLDSAVLAKLMVLEELHLTDFQRLFDWQVRGEGGTVAELEAAEQRAFAAAFPRPAAPGRGRRRASSESGGASDRAEETAPAEESELPDPEVVSWADQPHIARWLRLEPALGRTDLGPYFTYARAKLTVTVGAARLPAALQDLLVRLQSDVVGARRSAARSVGESVQAENLPLLMDQLLARVLRDPDSGAWDSAVEIAERVPDTVAAVCHTLGSIPLDGIPRAKLSSAVRRLPGDRQEVAALLDGWQNSGHGISPVVARLRAAGRGRSA